MKTFIIAFLVISVTSSGININQQDLLKPKLSDMPLSNSIFAPSKKSPLSSESEYDDESVEIVPVRPSAPPPPPPQTQSDLDVLSQLKNYQKKLGTTQKNDSQEQPKELPKPVQISEPPRPAQKPDINVAIHNTEEESSPKRSDDFEQQKQAQLEKYAKKFHLGGERQVDQDIQQYMPKVQYQPIAIKPQKEKSISESEYSEEVVEKPPKPEAQKKSEPAKHLDGLDFFNTRLQQTTVKQAIPKDDSESEEVEQNKKSHSKDTDKQDQYNNKKQSTHQDKKNHQIENSEDEQENDKSKNKSKQKIKSIKPQSDSESESESESEIDKSEQLKQKQQQEERDMLERLRKKSMDKKSKAKQEPEQISESEDEIQQPPKSKKNQKSEEKPAKFQPDVEQPQKQKFITATKPKEQENSKKKQDDEIQKHQLLEFLQKQPEETKIQKGSKKHDESLNCETSQNHQVQLICQLCEGQRVHLVNQDNWEDVELAEEFSESFGALMGFILKSIGDGDYLLSRVDQVVCVASAQDIQHTVNVEKVLKHFTGRSLSDYESVVDLPSKAEAQVFLLSAEYDSLLKGFSCKKFTLGIKTDLSYDLGDSELLVKQVVLQKAKLKIRYNGILQAKGLSHPAWLEVSHGTHTLSISSLSLPKEEAIVTNIAECYLGDYARELLPMHRNNQIADLEVQTHVSDDNLGLTLNLRRKK